MATAVKAHRNYSGGAWVDATGGETFESADPATGFEPWRLTPAPKRAEILYRVAQTLVERA
jgi:alpha-ketoglutaric semialdehyde dehydrogenase